MSVDSNQGPFIAAGRQFHGTVKDFSPFDAKVDAQKLRKAMKGIGTDENTVINILTKRSEKQRQEIIKAYKTLYRKNLQSSVKGDFSGITKEALLALLYPRDTYLAVLLHQAVKGVGTDLGEIAEVICSLSPQELEMVQRAYKQEYKKELAKAIGSDTSGDVKTLLLDYIKGNRMGPRSPGEIEADAKILQTKGFKNISGKGGVAEILSTRNQQDLQKIFAKYQANTKKSVLSQINSDLTLKVTDSGKTKKVLQNLVQCINNPPEYYAKRIKATLWGPGTKDHKLLRLIIARSEIDLAAIKEAYQRLYKKPLKKAVDSDTTRKFQKVLDGLIVGNV
ncbi:annexin A4-like [Gordionus sp. m RMFG-2023]|uniref:annexin A4-like n=1 Tax=Gordionus sp. m RMFG-2023 TaxID=3053472 RepID=UPI0031FCCE83